MLLLVAMAGLPGLSAAIGYAFRRGKRLLPVGPRRAVVLDHLAVALELVAELQAPVPQVVREGGLLLLATLAGGNGGVRGGVREAAGVRGLRAAGAPGAAAVGGVPRRGCSAGLAPAIARPPPAAAAADLGLLGGVQVPDQGGLFLSTGGPCCAHPGALLLLPAAGVPRRRRRRCRAASRRGARLVTSGLPEEAVLRGHEEEVEPGAGDVAEAVVSRAGSRDEVCPQVNLLGVQDFLRHSSSCLPPCMQVQAEGAFVSRDVGDFCGNPGAWIEWGMPVSLLLPFSDAVGVGSEFVVFGGTRQWAPPAWHSKWGRPPVLSSPEVGLKLHMSDLQCQMSRSQSSEVEFALLR